MAEVAGTVEEVGGTVVPDMRAVITGIKTSSMTIQPLRATMAMKVVTAAIEEVTAEETTREITSRDRIKVTKFITLKWRTRGLRSTRISTRDPRTTTMASVRQP